MSGTLTNPRNRVTTVTIDPMEDDVTLVNLGGAGTVFCNPTDDFTLNIVPHQSGTQVDVINLFSDSSILYVNYGASPYTSVALINQSKVSLTSYAGEWFITNFTGVAAP